MRAEKQARPQQQEKQSGAAKTSGKAAHTAGDETGGEGVASVEGESAEGYAQSVRELFSKQEFKTLDAVAHNARAQKTRFVGGGWKLFTFYLALSPQGNRASVPDTEAIIEKLKRWVAQEPKSVTARIALAQAYHDYAWLARGDSYAGAVNEESWKPFRERLAMAEEALDDANQVAEKCPQWFVVIERIGRSEGWNLSRLHEYVNSADAFEPTYFYVYQEYAFTLQPKWMGQEGDAERFADQITSQMGGRDGAEVYFKLAADMYCGYCNQDTKTFGLMSWRRMQDGYAAIKERYGISDLVLNQMTWLAVQAKDRSISLKLFMDIGDRWNKDVWGTETNFQTYRSSVIEPPDYIRSAWLESAKKQTAKDKQYQEHVQVLFGKQSASAMRKCELSVKDDSQKFFVAVKLGSNGAAMTAKAWPPTRFSECLMPKLSSFYPPPPSDGYWVFLPVHFKAEDTKSEGQK